MIALWRRYEEESSAIADRKGLSVENTIVHSHFHPISDIAQSATWEQCSCSRYLFPWFKCLDPSGFDWDTLKQRLHQKASSLDPAFAWSFVELVSDTHDGIWLLWLIHIIGQIEFVHQCYQATRCNNELAGAIPRRICDRLLRGQAWRQCRVLNVVLRRLAALGTVCQKWHWQRGGSNNDGCPGSW